LSVALTLLIAGTKNFSWVWVFLILPLTFAWVHGYELLFPFFGSWLKGFMGGVFIMFLLPGVWDFE